MERRVPAKKQVGGFLLRVLPAAIVVLSGILIAFVVLTYRLMHPAAVPESVNPAQYLLPSVDVGWAAREGNPIAGWWIPGPANASAIVLAPGYGMSRADVLSLAVALQKAGFSVLTYDERGSGAAPRGASTFGLRETDDLLAALDFLKTRPAVNPNQVGIWGADVGARAALRVAAARREVRAVVVDSVFDSTGDFISLRLHEDLGLHNRVLETGCSTMFRLYRLAFPASAHEKFAFDALADRNLLLIQGENRPELAVRTAEIYGRIQARKQMIKLPIARMRNMSGEEMKSYDRRVADYFRVSLR
jgi:hypothetical protein